MSSGTSALAELLGDLASALDGLGVRWYLFGAQAAIVYGVTRLTGDVDVTVDLGTLRTTDLVATLVRSGFQLRVADIDDFVASTRVLPLRHDRTRLPVDLVLAGPGLEELFFDRVVVRAVGEATVPVASPEDIVAMKILAGRPHDLDDAAAIIRAGRATLDLDLVRRTLRLLEEALHRADLVPELDRLARS